MPRLEIEHPELRALYEFWRGRAGARGMPLRQEIDLAELARWVDYLVLVDVLGDGEDFRYRMHGIELIRSSGLDMLGRRLSEAPPIYRDVVLEEYRAIYHGRQPVVGPFNHRQETWRRWEKLMLPLSFDGQRVDQILAALYPHAAAIG